MAIKPTGGWDANSFIVFDYQGKDDFKFAGLDVSINKLVMGHRDATGWYVDEQAVVRGGVKSDRYYNMLLSVNGVNATLVVDNQMVFTHTFQPRVKDGYSYGLNWGLVGVGSNNSRGAFDNVVVQILPPQVTLDELEDFNDGVADRFTADPSWSVGNGVYSATPTGAGEVSQIDLGIDGLKVSSYLELNTTVQTAGRAGFIFDRYGDENFKFAVLDAVSDQLVIGHYTARSGWVDDAVVSTTIDAGTSYELNLTLKGTTVSLLLNPNPAGGAQATLGYVFNAATVDGKFGLLASGGQASFDDVRVKTDDPAFLTNTGANQLAAQVSTDATDGEMLTQPELDAITTAAFAQWIDLLGEGDARLAALGDVRFGIADLPGSELGYTEGGTVLIDADAAGTGWFVDPTPADNGEFRPANWDGAWVAPPSSPAYGRMDLLTTVMHEFGHVLGFTDDADLPFMAKSLDDGLRLMPAYHDRAVSVAEPAVTSQQQVKVQVFHETLNELLELEEANLLGHVARADLDGHPVDDFIVDVFDGKKHDHDDDHADDIAAGLDDAVPETVSAGTGTAENATRNSDGGGHKQGGLIDWTAGSSLVDRLVNRIGE
jgi:hypothetical protein